MLLHHRHLTQCGHNPDPDHAAMLIRGILWCPFTWPLFTCVIVVNNAIFQCRMSISIQFIRPPDDNRKVLSHPRVLFWHPGFNLPDGRETSPSEGYQRFGPRLNSWNSLRHFARPSKSAKFGYLSFYSSWNLKQTQRAPIMDLCPSKAWYSSVLWSLRKWGEYFSPKNGPENVLHLPARAVALLRDAYFIEAHNLWLPKTRDFSSVDYRILAVLQERVYTSCVRRRWVEATIMLVKHRADGHWSSDWSVAV